jgi:hypothetical protein
MGTASFYEIQPETVDTAGQDVAGYTDDADALGVSVLESVQAAAESVLHPDDGVTGLHLIGAKVAQALLDFGEFQVQPMLSALSGEILRLGLTTSEGAAIVEDADLVAAESFAWPAVNDLAPS